MLSAQAQHLYALKVLVNILPRKGLTSESYVPPINKVLIALFCRVGAPLEALMNL